MPGNKSFPLSNFYVVIGGTSGCKSGASLWFDPSSTVFSYAACCSHSELQSDSAEEPQAGALTQLIS